jgi:Protein of unknown function (DUF4013)
VSGSEARLDPNLAIRLFFRDPDWRMKSGVGGIFSGGALMLFFLGPLFIPFAFCLWGLLMGYYLRLVRSKIVDMNAPLPPWNDWLDLLISGITWIAVAFGQSLVPISIATIALLFATAGGPTFVVGNNFTLWAVSSVGAVTFSWVVVSLVSTVIMANFAKQERMSAAFDVFTVGKKLGTSALIFTQAWLLMLGIQWMGFVLPTISVLGVTLLPICGFISSCIGSILLAQAWSASEALAKP